MGLNKVFWPVKHGSTKNATEKTQRQGGQSLLSTRNFTKLGSVVEFALKVRKTSHAIHTKSLFGKQIYISIK